MITKEIAIEVHAASRRVIVELSTLLRAAEASCSGEDYERIKRGIGLTIGTIQVELMDLLYVDHPELDDLA